MKASKTITTILLLSTASGLSMIPTSGKITAPNSTPVNKAYGCSLCIRSGYVFCATKSTWYKNTDLTLGTFNSYCCLSGDATNCSPAFTSGTT